MTNHTQTMKTLIGDCQRCALKEHRNRIVFGTGTVPPMLLLVGEAPGRQEDEGGEPFIGRSGKYLTEELKKLGFDRSTNLFITNTCRCRPLNNRTPKVSEIKSCLPFLHQEIALLQPKIILTLGLVPSKALLGSGFKMGEGHGVLYNTPQGQIYPTYHPAAVLRNPKLKEPFLTDLKNLKSHLSQ